MCEQKLSVFSADYWRAARRDRAGGVDNHQRIEILAIQQNGYRPDIAVAAGVIAQIERVRDCHMPWQCIAQFLAGFFA